MDTMHMGAAGVAVEREIAARYRAQRDRLRAALEEVEWGGTFWRGDEGEPGCPSCDHSKRYGHSPDCTLAAALAASRED